MRLHRARSPAPRKAVDQGIRDVFHVKSKYFDQIFHATFFLDPLDPASDAHPPAAGPPRRPAPLPRSRQASPRRGQGGPEAPPPLGAAEAPAEEYSMVFDETREGPAIIRGVPPGAGGSEAWASQVARLRQELDAKAGLVETLERRLEVGDGRWACQPGAG